MAADRKDLTPDDPDAHRATVNADPEADLERGKARKETDPREKVQYEGDVLHEEPDPMEVDPGIPPRSPI